MESIQEIVDKHIENVVQQNIEIITNNIVDEISKKVLDGILKFLEKKEDVEQAERCDREKYMTSNQVKEYLHIDKTTLWRYGKAGMLTPIKAHKKTLYERQEVERILKDF